MVLVFWAISFHSRSDVGKCTLPQLASINPATRSDLLLETIIVPQEPLSLQQIEREIQRAKDRQSETGGDIDYSDLEALLREKLKKFAAFNASFSNVGACLGMHNVLSGWKNLGRSQGQADAVCTHSVRLFFSSFFR